MRLNLIFCLTDKESRHRRNFMRIRPSFESRSILSVELKFRPEGWHSNLFQENKCFVLTESTIFSNSVVFRKIFLTELGLFSNGGSVPSSLHLDK